MDQDIITFAKTRYSAKVFDPNKKIPPEHVEKIKDLLRYAPSSVNGQPWHFLIASTDVAKEKIAQAATGVYIFNQKSILNASHVIVFCAKKDIDTAYLSHITEQEFKDGRFDSSPVTKEMMNEKRAAFVSIHAQELKDLDCWIEKQVYLNVGAFLLGLSTLGLDAVPMEGVETKTIDQEFGLQEKGYRSVMVVPVGYADHNKDFNAKLPKSRLPIEEILSEY